MQGLGRDTIPLRGHYIRPRRGTQDLVQALREQVHARARRGVSYRAAPHHLGAELRATGLEEAPFSSVWHRIHASMACAPTGNTKKLMRLLAPKHAGEFLEVVERLAEASLLALHFDGERVSSAAHGGGGAPAP